MGEQQNKTTKGYHAWKEECALLRRLRKYKGNHLLFLKDKQAFVPVKPTSFEAGLRKLGIEFYLSGCCSWDNYTKFLGYLERIREKLQAIEPETTLLDAHSILWIIGSGYWLDGKGAEKVEKVRRGEMTAEEAMRS